MTIKLRPLEHQVLVITGATSGIGLATARLAAAARAKVVMIARGGDELDREVEAIRAQGGQALAVEADVADAGAMNSVAQQAVTTFGGFDTWVNNAGVPVFGPTLDVPLSDERRVFDVYYWSVVNGCRAAVPHLRRRGGAIINVGGMAPDRAVPLQAACSAAKHAVRGFTDALRMEIEREGLPISVTLVTPAAIDTPFFEYAADYTDHVPTHPPPVYSAEKVAQTILRCAVKPVRDVTVGGAGRALTLLGALTPHLADVYMERSMFNGRKSRRLPVAREGALRRRQPGAVSGKGHPAHVIQSSMYTRAALSDIGRALPFILIGLALGVGWKKS
jgi:NAD(P)-dependent dehydrogenase (short-subunit alcohol dehydrogenase family)